MDGVGWWESTGCRGKKTVFLSHLCIKTIFLPRQARDKHRESTQKRDYRFLAASEHRGVALRGGSGARASNMKEVSGYGAWMARVRLDVLVGGIIDLPSLPFVSDTTGTLIDNVPQGSL